MKGGIQNMNKFVLDSSAWIEYLDGSEKGSKIKKYIDETENSIYSNGLIVAEVCVAFLKRGYEPLNSLITIQSISKFLELEYEIGLEAAKMYYLVRKNNNKFSLADAVILTLANSINGKVITCDSDFVGIKNAIFIS